MDRRKKVIIRLDIGCGVVAIRCIALAALALITGGTLIKWVMQQPENVNIDVDTPIQVTKGEPVVIRIQVENVAAESQLLHSSDISSEYLAGIAIREAEPPFVDSFQIPFGSDMESYTFEQQIPLETTLLVQFFGIAVKAGDFSGQIDVCINSGSICETFLTRTIIEE